MPCRVIDTIMIFAAGRGKRMVGLSKNQPKPVISILGKQILHYALELAVTYPFKQIIINTHYFPKQILNSIRQFECLHPNIGSKIMIIHESELLETGGAIKNAKHFLGDRPIFTMNSDIIIQSDHNIFDHMISKWQQIKADFLLLMHPTNQAIGYIGNGDFEIDVDGKLYKPTILAHQTYSYMYSGLQILDPNIIYQNPKIIFSLADYFHDNTYQRYGILTPSECRWYHANTPEDIDNIEKSMVIP